MNRLAHAEALHAEDSPQEPGRDLVTVAVSLFNYAAFLPACLDSVAAQHHQSLDLIVVDDASDQDDSAEVARAWLKENAGRFCRSILLRHGRNQGLAQARNTAFGRARTEAVFVIDADNMIYPRAISRLKHALDETGAAAAYTQLEFFGSERRLGYADVWTPEAFRTGNYVDAMALISRQAWRAVRGYTHLEGGWEDYEFWCKFVDRGLSAIYVPEVLCRYRVHAGSMLRTEALSAHRRLSIQMMSSHPWLDL